MTDGRFAEVAMVTMLGACGGILGAYVATVVLQRTVDIGMVCNGLIAGLVAITAPSGYVENWAAPIIGIVGGLIVVPSIMLIDKKLDDPVGVLSAHGARGHLGHARLRPVHRAAVRAVRGHRQPGRRPRLLGLVPAARRPGARRGRRLRARARALPDHVVRDRKTIGLRVTEEEEIAGLDISEHGMYGYPEQFIPDAELYGSPAAAVGQAQRAHAGDGRIR